jgi:hypothetical protein
MCDGFLWGKYHNEERELFHLTEEEENKKIKKVVKKMKKKKSKE